MALIVEDGTGKSDSESLCSVAVADTRHSNLGNTDWAAYTTEQKEQKLRKATIYMTQKFRQSWQGSRVLSTQALDFPRTGVVVDGFAVSSSIVPTDIQNGCADLALKATVDLLPDLTRPLKSKKIGPIEKVFESGQEDKRYRAVQLMFQPYFSGFGVNQIPLIRA